MPVLSYGLQRIETRQTVTRWIRPTKTAASRCSRSRFESRSVFVCGAGFDPNPKTSKKKTETVVETSVPELDDSEIEARLLQRRQRRKSSVENREDFKVDTESVPSEADKELETTIISVLGSLFGLILLNGIVIAASGFLPAEVDSFVQKILYPSFTPVVGVFLVCSTLYGIWKTRSDRA